MTCVWSMRGAWSTCLSYILGRILRNNNDVIFKNVSRHHRRVHAIQTQHFTPLEHKRAAHWLTWKLRLLNLEGPILPRFSFFFFSSALIFFHSAAERPSGMYTILSAALLLVFTGRSWVDGGAKARPPEAPAKAATAKVETVRILMLLLEVSWRVGLREQLQESDTPGRACERVTKRRRNTSDKKKKKKNT